MKEKTKNEVMEKKSEEDSIILKRQIDQLTNTNNVLSATVRKLKDVLVAKDVEIFDLRSALSQYQNGPTK